MKRSYLVVLVLVLGFLGLLSLDLWYRDQIRIENSTILMGRLSYTKRQLEESIAARIRVVENLRDFFVVTPNFPDIEYFNRYSAAALARSPSIRALQYVDTDHIIRYIYPLEGNEVALNLDLMTRPAAPFVEKAIQTGLPTINNPTRTVQGSLAIVIRVPILTGDRYLGLAQGVIDLDDLLGEDFLDPEDVYRAQLIDADGEKFWGEDFLASSSYAAAITVGDTFWTLNLDWRGGAPKPSLLILMIIWGLGGGSVFGIVYAVNQTYSRIEGLSITLDQKQAELLESQLLYQKLFNSSHDAVFLLDTRGGILNANDTAVNRYGYSLSELTKLSVLDLALPELRDSGPDILKQAISDKMHFDWVHVLKDGKKLDVEVGAVPISIDGKPNILSTVRDISERKRNEAIIREERERSEMYLNLAPSIIISLDTNGNVSMINDYGCEVLEGERDQILGKNWFENFLPEGVREEVRSIFLKIHQEDIDDFTIRENEIITLAGKIKYISWHNAILRDEAGLVIGTLASGEDITESKKAQSALRIVEDRYRAVVDSQEEFINRLSPDGKIVFTNPAYCRYLGLGEEDVLGTTIWRHMSDPDQKLIQEKFARLTLDNPVEIEEHMQFTPEGEIRWHKWSDQGIFDERGELVEIQSVGFDITEERIAQAALRESEERYRLLLESSPIGIAVHSGGKIIFSNSAGAVILGAESPEELIGKSVTDILHPDRVEEGKKRFEAMQRGVEGLYPVEDIYQRLDGKSINVEVRAVPLTYQNLPAVQVMVTDITERKQIETALKVSEDKYRTLFESMNEGFVLHEIITDDSGSTIDFSFVEMNPAAERLVEMRADQLIGRKASDLSSRSAWIKRYGRVGLTGVPEQFEDYNERLDRWFDIFAFQPKIGFCAVILTDVTERRKATMEIEESRAQLRNLANYLQHAREDERKYIAREIHDEFGQNLTALKIDLNKLGQELNADQGILTEKIYDMTQSVDASIDRVRRLSSHLRPGLLDNLGLIAAIDWLADDFEKYSGVKVVLNIPDNEIELPPDVATDLYRICQESLTNVARHSEASEVTIDLDQKEHDLVLTIKDDGRGITEKEINQSKSLGLLGMSERVLIHGGAILISGGENQGTEVVVRIPYSKDLTDKKS